MVKQLLKEVFEKLLKERDNNNKTKNGCSVYFVNEILERRYHVSYLISERTVVDYYNKHVLGKSNKSKEPNSELKNLMANYLGFEDYSSFELSKKEMTNSKKNQVLKINRFIIATFMLSIIAIVYGFSKKNKSYGVSNNKNHYSKEYHIQIALYDMKTNNILSISKKSALSKDSIKQILRYHKESEISYTIPEALYVDNKRTTEPDTKHITDNIVLLKNPHFK